MGAGIGYPCQNLERSVRDGLIGAPRGCIVKPGQISQSWPIVGKHLVDTAIANLIAPRIAETVQHPHGLYRFVRGVLVDQQIHGLVQVQRPGRTHSDEQFSRGHARRLHAGPDAILLNIIEQRTQGEDMND